MFNMKIILVRYIISTLTTGSGELNMRVKYVCGEMCSSEYVG